MKRSELKSTIREMIVAELTMVDKMTTPDEAAEIAKDEKKDVATVKSAIDSAKKSGKPVGIAEDETLMEMAKIAGDLKSAIEKGESCRVILRNNKKDGTLFWNELYIMPITNSEGLVTNFIGIQEDITDKKREEEERRHLSTIFDDSLNEIHVFDTKTLKFVQVNFGAQKNLGYTMDELLKMTPLDILPYKDEAEFRGIVDILLKKNVQKLEVESVHYRKDGTTYPVEVHLQLSKLGEQEVFVAIILDITERKNYTTKLENKVVERTKQLKESLRKEIEINELKTRFLSLLSHEFKTPLSAILTSSLLLSKYQLTEQQSNRNKHIRTITDKVHLLNNILNSFLSIEKFESGNLSYQFREFKIGDLVNNIIYNAKLLLKEGQQIKYRENIVDLSLYQDEQVIELILTHLIHNAIKYSPENSIIYIDIEQNDDLTTLKIIDNGIGIPSKDQKNILLPGLNYYFVGWGNRAISWVSFNANATKIFCFYDNIVSCVSGKH